MFKPSFTQAEMKELFDWFEVRKGQLPKDMQLNKSTYIPNLQDSVDKMIRSLKGREISSSLAGMASILFTIKEKLEEA